ncbi:MAG TPA: HK97-gp10 family putative phage morphogenesis protein [Stellaceae bacterium]|jgi:HK97 gp10 family phage protein
MAATIEGLEALVGRLEAMPGKLTAALGDEAARLGEALRAAVERNLSGAVLQQRSGRLASSIDVSIERTGSAVSATVGSDVPYAAIHEYGGVIPAHEILPKSARALAFPWQGRERFFKRVELPAVQMPERSFMRSALAEMAPEIRAAMAAAANRAVTS